MILYIKILNININNNIYLQKYEFYRFEISHHYFVYNENENTQIRLTGQYSQTKKFAISHALLAEKCACLRINLLYSRLSLK